MKPIIPNSGEHMTLRYFIDRCKVREFVNWDGTGYYATDEEISDIEVKPSEIREGKVDYNWSHVVWFNK